MHLLLTRPLADDDPLPELLRARGHTVTQDPLLRIEPLQPVAVDASGIQAVVVTSSNALRGQETSGLLAPLTDLPLFAVGRATAAAARQLGFADIRTGDGEAADLVSSLTTALNTSKGAVLYLRGLDVAFDLTTPLQAAGFDVRSCVVYRAVAAKAFAPETIAGIARGSIQGVVLMSPRTAETYAELAVSAGIAGELPYLVHYCLSSRVAEPLQDLVDIPVRVPMRPELQELVALIDLDATQS
jgi:uroporphyrinogen-III synthase